MSKICVIVPVYKVELFIQRCIDSIWAQSFKDFDLLLVDDGSPDRCGEICDEYAKKDKRVHVIHKINGGLSAARNTGIDWSFEHSDSKWLTFIDSDDWVHSLYLETLYHAVEKTKLFIATVAHKATHGEEIRIDESLLDAKVVKTLSFYCSNAIFALAPWGKLYHKDCFQNIRYPLGRVHEDEFTTYKLLFLYKKIAYINQPLYAYFQNPEGIIQSTNKQKLRMDKIDALIEQISFFSEKKCVVAEMQRLIICAEQIKIFNSKANECSEPQIKHISKAQRKLLQKYPNVFWFHDFLKHHHHKSIYPLLYYLYKIYVIIRTSLNFDD